MADAGAQTTITFCGGDSKEVVGSPDEVARLFQAQRGGGPIRLETTEGTVLFVNWANVLYLQPSWPPAAA